MRVLSGSRAIASPLGPFAVAIGIFDGVHLGHRALLETAVRAARESSVTSLAYTFNPHPAAVLAPGIAPKLIEPVERRLERFGQLGIEATLVEPFDLELAAIAPEEFVTGTLVGKLRAKHVVVGEDFSFGHRGAGRVPLLHQLGERHGFTVHAIPAVLVGGERVSSSRIRELVSQGDVRRAATLLGRPYAVTGRVIRGAGRGATIGIPTANLETHYALLPAIGVYATRTTGPFGTKPSVTNVGVNPTFGAGGPLRIETHVLDWDGAPLYGAELEVELVERLRDERKFGGVEELKKQIWLDVARAREVLAG
jgi:riboflavin kinase / FMN adenylyltransferase